MSGLFARRSLAFRALALSLSGAFVAFACGGRTAADLGLSSSGGSVGSQPPLNPAESPPISSTGGGGALGGAATGGKPVSETHGGTSTTAPDGPGGAEGGRANGAAGTPSGELGGLGGTVGAAGGDGLGGGGAGGSGGDSEADGGEGGEPPSNCCTAKATPSCDDPRLASCVCHGQGQFGGDSFCCSATWDDQCAAEVETFGCGVCPSGS